MRVEDLHILPKVRDSWSFLYLEHARIDQHDLSIAAHDKEGMTPIPCAGLTALLLGPGTSITQAAMTALADTGCAVLWTGEEGVRLYGFGFGETRSAANLLRQAAAWADPVRRLAVVRRMYAMRFDDPIGEDETIEQLRGREGNRVRSVYARWAKETGVPWTGRRYDRKNWAAADPINQALSVANAALYGVCAGAIVSAGYSPGIGFIHTGFLLAFVFDVADLYKADTAIPVAFQTVANGSSDVETRVRKAMRDRFRETRLLERIVNDLEGLFGAYGPEEAKPNDEERPGGLWDGAGIVPTGVNYGDEP
ncbi:MAG: CRISPR-associated endonuclease Cas1 2 [Dehalococcoidia bacterium]|nr:MAG: CRISPR-associated endonuclease Cas1 2 [Dehalococcoidia bacterium]